jgi:hypothetical protein
VPGSMRIVLDVDPLSAPLVGTLSTGTDPRRQFVGLVELLVAVEEAVSQARCGDERDAEPNDHQ